jgi:hypothetical protein
MSSRKQYYIRFVDKEFPIFGESKYRPSEGWIDVESYSIDKEFNDRFNDHFILWVTITDESERAGADLVRAQARGWKFKRCILEARDGDRWYRWEFQDVTIRSSRHFDDFFLAFAKVEAIYGGFLSPLGWLTVGKA